jgi:RNA polymerase sigma factor (sigma-70 family)
MNDMKTEALPHAAAPGSNGFPYSDSSRAELERLFLANLGLIRRIAWQFSRRYGLSDADSSEFVGSVELKLLSDDYRVFRQFRGGSSLATYLTTVIHNQCRDFTASRWGKWRPTTAARRMGPVAVELEKLTKRDGYSEREAIEAVRCKARGEHSVEKLEKLANRLPPRTTRAVDLHRTGLDTSARSVDRIVLRELASTFDACSFELRRAMGRLSVEEREILGLRFWSGLTVAAISEMGTHKRPLYGRLNGILARLRRDLEGAGFRRDEVLDAIGALSGPSGEPV